MMGKSHSTSAVAAGLGVAPLLGLTTLVSAAPFALIAGGAGTLPDLDHRRSSASRVFGRFGYHLSGALRGLSNAIYQRTKGPKDEPEGKHRHLTHTILFALVVGGALAGLCWLAPPLALAVYAATAMLTADRLGDRVLIPAGIGLVPHAALLYQHPEQVAWQTGLAVALGMVTHDLGDALTHSGAPILAGLWPFPIAGETWFEVKLLGPLSFRTNGPVEHWVAFPLILGATAAAVVPLDPLAGLAAQLPTSHTLASLLIGAGALLLRLAHLLVKQAKKHPVLVGR